MPTTESVTVSIGVDGTGATEIAHAPADCTIAQQPIAGTANIQPSSLIEGRTCVNVVNATAAASGTVSVEVAIADPAPASPLPLDAQVGEHISGSNNVGETISGIVESRSLDATGAITLLVRQDEPSNQQVTLILQRVALEPEAASAAEQPAGDAAASSTAGTDVAAEPTGDAAETTLVPDESEPAWAESAEVGPTGVEVEQHESPANEPVAEPPATAVDADAERHDAEVQEHASDAPVPVQSDAPPQEAGTAPSESAGVSEQGGSPSEEPATGESQQEAADAAAGETPAPDAAVELVKCPVCQHEFVPGTPVM